jgi:serine/threonine-protein kinase
MTPLPIDAERRRTIDDLFDGALDQPRDQRSAWLLARCGDAGLRLEVEALLRAHDRSEGILERNAADAAAAVLRDPIPDRHIGPYRVLRELGRGGMGVVYLAERAGSRSSCCAAAPTPRSSTGGFSPSGRSWRR